MPTRFPAISLGAAIAALALASLALTAAPLYDPFGWLVWGRELTDLSLDTSAGPSWKPLPALLGAALTPLGDAAPDGWLVLARAGWIAAAVLAGLLAARLAVPEAGPGERGDGPARIGRRQVLAGAIAAAGVVLLHDSFTSWTRQFAGGLSEPLLVALVLAAVERHLAGRRGRALALGFTAGLVRPEVWPFLLLYAIQSSRRAPRLRLPVAAGGVALVVLWLVPDLLGSGDPLTGAARARDASDSAPGEALEAIGRALELPLAALWAAATAMVLDALRRGERKVPMLAATAAGWMALVALLAGAGYAGLPRFAAPAGALACVLGGAGAARLLAGAWAPGPHRRLVALAAAALAAGLLVQGAFRAAEIPGELEAAAYYARGEAELGDLVEELGEERLLACGPIATAEIYTQTALAWRIEQPISAVSFRVESIPTLGTFLVQEGAPAATRAAARAAGRPRARAGRWAAYAISCAETASSASGRRIAGVAGARR